MKKNLIAEASVLIDATATEVWKAITTPVMIRKYLMGTTVRSQFTEGSEISYEGEYNGKKYHDKGRILQVEPGRLFRSTYWSSMGGKPDAPENYNTVSYELVARGEKTEVILTQDGIGSEEERRHMVENWTAVLGKLKEVVEAREAVGTAF